MVFETESRFDPRGVQQVFSYRVSRTEPTQREAARARVCALTMHSDARLVRDAMEARAAGYVAKSTPFDAVNEAIRAIAADGTCFSDEARAPQRRRADQVRHPARTDTGQPTRFGLILWRARGSRQNDGVRLAGEERLALVPVERLEHPREGLLLGILGYLNPRPGW